MPHQGNVRYVEVRAMLNKQFLKVSLCVLIEYLPYFSLHCSASLIQLKKHQTQHGVGERVREQFTGFKSSKELII